MKYIILDKSNFLGKGGERECYIHPNDDKKVIKVLHLKEKHNRQNELEFEYYKYLEKNISDFSQITKCFGWIETNKGRGLVCQRIENYDNSKIRTLSHYSKYNLLDEKEGLTLINELKEYLLKNSILFVDASLSNVFCQKVSKDSFKLIVFDGLGARRYGLKFWLYLRCKTFTKYKIKKQWHKFLRNYNYERSLKLKYQKENIEY